MKHRIITGTILIVFVFAALISAQEQQTKIDLPELSLEQKASRSAWFHVNAAVLGIAYSKSLGKTAEDYGRFQVKFFAPGWHQSQGSPIRLIQGMYRNQSLNSSFKMEIASASTAEVKGRMTVNGTGNFTGGMYMGVSLEEYMNSGKVWREGLADYLGLVWKEDFDGEWINFTLSVKQ